MNAAQTVRAAHAFLVRERMHATSIPELGMRCDSAEVPFIDGPPATATHWLALGVFEGTAAPYPAEAERPPGQRIVNAMAWLVTDSHLYGVVSNEERRPAVWIAAPLTHLDIAVGELSGFIRKKPFEIIISGPDWRVSTAVTNRLDASSARKRSAGGAEFLTALGGPRASAAPGRRPGMRPMVGVCAHGRPSSDPDVLPELAMDGTLVLEPGESVEWTGGCALVTTAATAAGGREKFVTMWVSGRRGVALTLTNHRLIFLVPPEGPRTGADYHLTATAASAIPGLNGHESGHTVAGQIRHTNLANVIAGDGADYADGNLFRLTATTIDPPTTGVRIHFLFPSQRDANADQWIRMVAAQRTRAFPELESFVPQKWEVLVGQRTKPQFTDGYWGPMAKLPLSCYLGEAYPRS